MLWFLKPVLIPEAGSYVSTLSTCRFRCRLPGKHLRKKGLHAAQVGVQPEKHSIVKGFIKEQ